VEKKTFNDSLTKNIFRLYNILWEILIPALRFNKRLSDGFDQRMVKGNLPKADLWIQAASAGESYLAVELLKKLKTDKSFTVLVTSNTKQGLQILKNAVYTTNSKKNLSIYTSYFPFDKPSVMEKAVKLIRPKLMVLIEAEIWPGHIAALKKLGCKIIIVNGRITDKSLKWYLTCRYLWQNLKPDKILSISKNDASRWAKLFGKKNIEIISNMKFDRIHIPEDSLSIDNKLASIINKNKPFVVLGSVRREEEIFIEKIIINILKRKPDAVIGLFPRHMYRIKHWKKTLNKMDITWKLRSETDGQAFSGNVILWDVFGELAFAYKLAKAAFVGGSLAPVGGQNFIEPLIYGIIPVVGPFWDNFEWVEKTIFQKGLVYCAKDYKDVCNFLITSINKNINRAIVRKKVEKYIKSRQGSTITVCNNIKKILD